MLLILVGRESWAFEVNVEDGLVRFKNHALMHLEVLIEVEPRSICACFAIEAIFEGPALLLGSEGDAGLALRQ